MSGFALKIIALISMFIDHIGAVMLDGINPLRVVGRLAFPIFVYMIAEGFRHTKSPVKFLIRLGAFALISEVPFDIALNVHDGGVNFFAGTNIFYTLFFGGAAIVAFQRVNEWRDGSNVAYLPVILFMVAAGLLTSDYGAYGVLFIFMMYVIKPLNYRFAVMAAFCVLQFDWIFAALLGGEYVPVLYLLMIPATLTAVPLVAFYNGSQGRKMKWLFYIAYPAHLLSLAILIR